MFLVVLLMDGVFSIVFGSFSILVCSCFSLVRSVFVGDIVVCVFVVRSWF